MLKNMRHGLGISQPPGNVQVTQMFGRCPGTSNKREWGKRQGSPRTTPLTSLCGNVLGTHVLISGKLALHSLLLFLSNYFSLVAFVDGLPNCLSCCCSLGIKHFWFCLSCLDHYGLEYEIYKYIKKQPRRQINRGFVLDQCKMKLQVKICFNEVSVFLIQGQF